MPRLVAFAPLILVLSSACSNDGSSHQGADSGTPAGADAAPEASTTAVPEAGPEASPEGSPDSATINGYPKMLSDTGLFADIKTDTLGPGVRAYQPKYTLWSDGATKRRWLRFPAGTQIDTSDMDFWQYPVGTKVWKEFSLDGKRIETRMQYKRGPGDWVMIAYQWNDALTDAEAVPDGVQNANGTPHDIPSISDCMFCHGNMPDKLLGVTAIQLSHQLSGVKLTDLMTEHLLSAPPAGPFQIPGDTVAEQALGYLHANCGHCHNPNSNVYVSAQLQLWESTKALDTVADTTGYRTTVGQPNSALPQFHIIEPGRPSESELFLRISTRGAGGIVPQMPPIATEIVDPTGIAKIKAFIESLLPIQDGGVEAGVSKGDSGK